MEAETKLARCPFCKRDSLCFDGEEHAADFTAQPHVVCTNCHARGPIANNGTFEDAAALWNKWTEGT
jgi:hypothetical protein